MVEQIRPVSDENLREAVLTVLAADRRTASFELRVGVLSGIAHLAGVVDFAIKTQCGGRSRKTSIRHSWGGKPD